MLTDAGPLVALINRGDKHHLKCAHAMNVVTAPLSTSWPCFTEAMYLLYTLGGYHFQNMLWQWRRDGRLVLLDISSQEADLMDRLMQKYSDLPMDAADASLVALAESRGDKRIFTLDSDFFVYRLSDGTMLDIVG